MQDVAWKTCRKLSIIETDGERDLGKSVRVTRHDDDDDDEERTILAETYSNHAQLETTCRDWFRHFKNKDFDIDYKERSVTP